MNRDEIREIVSLTVKQEIEQHLSANLASTDFKKNQQVEENLPVVTDDEIDRMTPPAITALLRLWGVTGVITTAMALWTTTQMAMDTRILPVGVMTVMMQTALSSPISAEPVPWALPAMTFSPRATAQATASTPSIPMATEQVMTRRMCTAT